MGGLLVAALGCALLLEGLVPALLPDTWKSAIHFLAADEGARRMSEKICLGVALVALWGGYFLLGDSPAASESLGAAVAMGVGFVALAEGLVLKGFAMSEAFRLRALQAYECPSMLVRAAGAGSMALGLSLSAWVLF